MKINLVSIIIIFFSVELFAQLQSVSLFTDYSIAPSKRLQITDADAVGGGVKIKFLIAENIAININAGYKLYSLSEPDVLNKWGWIFWTERYYNKIVSDINADPNLSVEIAAIQKMDLIPFYLSFSYDYSVAEKILLTPSLGTGVYFYTRRMYAVENWSKYFPNADYTFSYSYRNFAPIKKGNPFYAKGELNIQYQLFEKLRLFSNFQYTYIIPTEGKFGYNSFPLENELSIAFGIAIYY